MLSRMGSRPPEIRLPNRSLIGREDLATLIICMACCPEMPDGCSGIFLAEIGVEALQTQPVRLS